MVNASHEPQAEKGLTLLTNAAGICREKMVCGFYPFLYCLCTQKYIDVFSEHIIKNKKK